MYRVPSIPKSRELRVLWALRNLISVAANTELMNINRVENVVTQCDLPLLYLLLRNFSVLRHLSFRVFVMQFELRVHVACVVHCCQIDYRVAIAELKVIIRDEPRVDEGWREIWRAR